MNQQQEQLPTAQSSLEERGTGSAPPSSRPERGQQPPEVLAPPAETTATQAHFTEAHLAEAHSTQASTAEALATRSHPIETHSAETSSKGAVVAIIGFGAAGVNALIALRTAGYRGIVRVFSNTRTLPYSPILTSYYAGGEKTYEECFPWSAEELEALGAEVMSDCQDIRLDPKTHTISAKGGVFEYTKCIIATGATPTCWGFENTNGYRPLVLRTMDDAERLRAAITRPGCGRVLVSGASMVALKTLEACLDHGLETTLVGMNPHVLDFNALPEAAVRFEKGLQDKGVQLRLGQTIKTLETIEDKTHPLGRRLEATFSTGKTDVFDEVAVAHGMKCNLDFLANGSLETDQALIVDEFMRTSDPDVYAAGDVAQALELISGEKRIVGTWKNAAAQGACAGRVIAAELADAEIPAEAMYRGSIPSNTITVKGTLFISAGTMEVTPKRRVEVRESNEMTVVLVFEETTSSEKEAVGKDVPDSNEAVGDGRRLVGFNIVCDEDEAGSEAYDVGAMLTLRIERDA